MIGFEIEFHDKKLLTEFVEKIKKYVIDYKAIIIKIDPDIIWKEYDYNRVDEYEVHFNNGTKIEFDAKGYLKSIDCGRNDFINKELLI